MKRTGIFALAALFLGLGSIQALAEAGTELKISGYGKSFSILFRPAGTAVGEEVLRDPDYGAVNNRVRLKLSFRPSEGMAFDLAYDFAPRIQDHKLFSGDPILSGFEPLEYRIDDLRSRLYPGPNEPVGSFALFHNLDRLSLTARAGPVDLILGRQAVAWGSARVINPTDVIAPFAFNELDQEERRGVDAFRVRLPLGMMDEMDVGVVAGRGFKGENSVFFIRGKTYQLQTDMSALAVGFRRHLLLGLDIARAVGGAGIWIEAAHVLTDFFREEKRPGEKDYTRLSVGLDYNFRFGLYSFLEYHFNSAGAEKAQDYLPLFQTSAYRDGSVYLMGRHYLNLGVTCQLHPLVPATGMLIWNLSDGSLILAPSAEYNIAENIYLSAGGFIGFGKHPRQESNPAADALMLRSEFGAYPDMAYTSFRVYF